MNIEAYAYITFKLLCSRKAGIAFKGVPPVFSVMPPDSYGRYKIRLSFLKGGNVMVHHFVYVICMKNAIPGSSQCFLICLPCVGKPGLVPITYRCQRIGIDDKDKHWTFIGKRTETCFTFSYIFFRFPA